MKRGSRRFRSQPRIPGFHRLPAYSALDPRIKDRIVADCMRWDSSASWIVATALAAFYGIDIVTPMGEVESRRQSRKRRA